jgi:hypothetical protein
MDKKEIKGKIQSIEKKIEKLKQEVSYFDALQQGLKLVLNGSVCPPFLRIGGTDLKFIRSIRRTIFHII